MIYAIAADLAEPGPTGARLAAWFDAWLERHAEPLPQFWIVEGALAAEQIMNGLAPLLDATDRLVVVKAATESIWHGVSPEDARWLAAHFPGSITNRIPDPAEGTRE